MTTVARAFPARPIPENGDVDVDPYNDELAALVTTTQNTRFTALGSFQNASFPDCER